MIDSRPPWDIGKMLVQSLTAPEELRAGRARGPVNEMSLHSPNLVLLAFMRCKSLCRGEGGTTKTRVFNTRLINVTLQSSLKRRAALQDG